MARCGPYLLLPFLLLALGGQTGIATLTHQPAEIIHSAPERYGPIALKRQQELRRFFDRQLVEPRPVRKAQPSTDFCECPPVALSISPLCRWLDPLFGCQSLQI